MVNPTTLPRAPFVLHSDADCEVLSREWIVDVVFDALLSATDGAPQGHHHHHPPNSSPLPLCLVHPPFSSLLGRTSGAVG